MGWQKLFYGDIVGGLPPMWGARSANSNVLTATLRGLMAYDVKTKIWVVDPPDARSAGPLLT